MYSQNYSSYVKSVRNEKIIIPVVVEDGLSEIKLRIRKV
jgi:hypothetical protein